MNKRISQTNVYVKKEMYEALLKLLEEKSFSAISVSDITAEANVSRMSFYRNYDSIEDILIEHLDAVVEQYKIEDIDEKIKETEKVYYGKKYMIHTFGFFYQNHDFIDTLISCGMGDLFLAKITEYLIQKWVDKESDTRKDTLKISAYAGSIYNMYREWEKGGFQEKPEEIADILYELR